MEHDIRAVECSDPLDAMNTGIKLAALGKAQATTYGLGSRSWDFLGFLGISWDSLGGFSSMTSLSVPCTYMPCKYARNDAANACM